MGRRMDWVPVHRFAEAITVNIGQVLQVPLYAPRSLDSAPEFTRYEEDNELFIHRIVGQMIYFHNGEIEQIYETYITPCLMDLDGADNPTTVFGNGTSVPIGTGWDQEKANSRFWYMRTGSHFGSLNILQSTGGANHPWWTFIDIKPKQKTGVNESPCLCVANRSSNAVALGFQPLLRMLISPVN